jgi:hypothetical protein
VTLETADIDVAPPPGVGFRPPLYFRVRAVTPGSLRVELWELGRPHGARSVSSAGAPSLEARRIALAAAELARQLRKQRIAELAALEEAGSGDDTPAGKSARMPLYARFVWQAGARGAFALSSSAWLLGPHADVVLAFDGGQRLALGGAWLAGDTVGGSLRWFEGRLAVSQGFSVSRVTELEAGLDAAVVSFRAHPEGEAPVDLLTGRAGLFARVNLRLGSVAVLGAGPDVGVLLHSVSYTHGNDTERLRGLWLGVGLTLQIDPAL